MVDKVYYNRQSIRISTTRAIFEGRTYPVNGITSVRGIIINPNRTWPISIMILGILLSGCYGISTLDALVGKNAVVAFSVPMMLIGFALVMISLGWLISQKPRHVVLICTSAGEHQAHVTDNFAEVKDIVGALNQAFIDRG